MPLPIAVSLMPEDSVHRMAELAVLAEQLDFSRCWVYDEGLVTRDVYVTLTAIAAATDRLPLGPGITNPFVRHPGATAAAIASLDEFSGGRAFVGIGAGGGLTLDPLGIERSRPVQAVGDAIEAMRALFAGGRVDLEGANFALRNARLTYARPGIEITVAGRGPRMTALGGALGDGFNLSYIHKDLLGQHTRSLRRAAGDRPFRISYATAIVTTDEEFEESRAQLSFRLVDSPAEVKERIGMTDTQVSAIRRALADGGPRRAARHVEPDWVSAFVVAGSPADCGEELRRLMADNDIDEFQLPTLAADDAGPAIERLAAMFGP